MDDANEIRALIRRSHAGNYAELTPESVRDEHGGTDTTDDLQHATCLVFEGLCSNPAIFSSSITTDFGARRPSLPQVSPAITMDDVEEARALIRRFHTGHHAGNHAGNRVRREWRH